MKRSFSRFLGVDLGGGRGKTTAIAELRMGLHGAEVIEVATRAIDKQRWTDDTLFNRLSAPAIDRDGSSLERAIAIDAPLTATACNRCTLPVCPGMETCAVPAVVWLRTAGRALVQEVAAAAESAGSRSAMST
ncbi:MAG TPA: hypothetical protein VGC41_15245, partial [Kofleriaceae bacterium]